MGFEADHVAVLLAAGASARLGRPKQLLTRDGEALVRRAARALLDTSPRELVVVLGGAATEVAAALDGIAYRAAFNADHARGLASSLQCAVDALRIGARVLIAGCDQPALDAGVLHALLCAARDAPGGCAAIAYGDRCGMPAVVKDEVLRRHLPSDGDRGLGVWLSRAGGVARLPAPELALDIDTAADVERARAAGWLDRDG